MKKKTFKNSTESEWEYLKPYSEQKKTLEYIGVDYDPRNDKVKEEEDPKDIKNKDME